MVKREPTANPDIDVEAPRPKRRKDMASGTPAVDEIQDQAASSDQEQEQGGEMAIEGPAMSPEEVQEEGLKVWQLLKDAVDKEGRSLSYDFLRLPSKRQFPDYYLIIKRPIALDDIKTQLDSYGYASLEALRQDFEQCFKNAKKYNMRESVIWKDAKALQKLAGKEFEKIRRRKDDDEGDGEGSDKETGKKKGKGANITRLMKNRLQKLTSKTEESTGRLVAVDFMDLPSKKKWPVYYKIIKKPICFEDIFKRIKRKEYLTIPDFMNDVELVFTNAIQFNEEHSPIWEDAMTLKNYFHELMTDLPAKYNMNAAAGDTSTSPEVAHSKILLKLPNHQTTSQTQGNNIEPLQVSDAAGGTVRLRVPALNNNNGSTTAVGSAVDPPNTAVNGIEGSQSKITKAKSPVVSPTALPPSIPSSSSPALVSTPKPAKAALPAQVKAQQTGTQSTFMNSPATPASAYHQYNANVQVPPQNFYTPSVLQSQSLAAAPSTTPASTSTAPAPISNLLSSIAGPSGRTDAPTPAPSARAAGLHSVRLETHPAGRRLALLDVGAGVRSWVVRLGANEKGLVVRDVRFEWRGDTEGVGSEWEREGAEGAEGTAPPKKRGRGRPRKTVLVEKDAIVKPAESSVKSTLSTGPNAGRTEKHAAIVPAVEDVVVRLDGLAVTPKANVEAKDETPMTSSETGGDAKATHKPKPLHESGEWTVDVAAGRHVLEVGRKGNNVPWRVYIYV